MPVRSLMTASQRRAPQRRRHGAVGADMQGENVCTAESMNSDFSDLFLWCVASRPRRRVVGDPRGRACFVIGRAGFAKISAVEGIRLKPAMIKRAAKAAAKGLSAEECRLTIVRSYRKGLA